VGGDSNDTNYIFLRFVTDYLPAGLVGLLIAVIFLAAWGSIAATLNSLASCTIIDFHRRFARGSLSGHKEYRLSQLYTLVWGIFCVAVAQLTYGLGNSLIEAVNVLGSLFYGVILGVFLVLNMLSRKGIVSLSFLWFNLVGAVGVLVLSEVLQSVLPGGKDSRGGTRLSDEITAKK
jgi:Na+/proline symporter